MNRGMKPTNRMIHFKDGQNRIGLQVMLDDAGVEFVHWRGTWTHPSEIPFQRSHEDEIGAQKKPKHVPVIHSQISPPTNAQAFIPTTGKQRTIPQA